MKALLPRALFSAAVFPRAAATVAGLAVWAAAGDGWAQCAMCRRSLEQGGGAGLMRGIYLSILLLLGVVFSIIGAFIFALWRGYQKRQAELAAAEDSSEASSASGSPMSSPASPSPSS